MNDGWVYLIQSENGLYKIGYATNVGSRMRHVQAMSPVYLSLVHSFRSTCANDLETKLHKFFGDKRHHGEWFALNERDVEFIKTFSDWSYERKFNKAAIAIIAESSPSYVSEVLAVTK